VLTLARDPATGKGARGATSPSSRAQASGAAWRTDEGTLLLGLGAEPLVTVKLGARPDKKLADEPALARFIEAVGSDATTAIVTQPLRFDPKRANLPAAPLSLAVGRRGGEAFVRLDVSDAL